ncbi:guanine nucleotide binding protein, alpha subunit [Mycena haematopus]|nr:guanine nucleotide binding protein, alpha subunit [Mycena haematopus]
MRPSDLDPLAVVLAPPENESPEEEQSRIGRERAAKQVSDAIDDELTKERQQAKRQPKPVKILLLGQSESGKSTTLKNFQLMCEPKAFRAERASWRAIIQLNVIRSVRIIIDATADPPSRLSTSTSISSSSSRDSHSLRPDADLLALRMRLLPLLEVHEALSCRLASPFSSSSCVPEPCSTDPARGALSTILLRRRREPTVNSSVPWKAAFSGGERASFASSTADPRASFVTDDTDSVNSDADWDADADDPGAMLHARADDLRRLWAHPMVHATLERQGIRLQEAGGFFLDELDVVTAKRYVPTDDHILRARLKTLGVAEHRMRLADPNGSITREFRIFDVGGHRAQRPKWPPYFDDMNCIIFLVPISAFDQGLEEEPEVGRLADSVALWRTITAHPLLQHANIILFLNKIDILAAKLSSGVRFCDYVSSYGRRPNDCDSAARYMKKQFGTILKESSPVPRPFYCHLTNAVDAKSTQFILLGIKDMLMHSHLRQSGLII